MRFFYTLALAIFIVFPAAAQRFSPGYYITVLGDTVKTNISIEKKDQSIDKVATPEGLFLAPKDLLGFGVNQVNYVVKSVSVDKTPTLGVVTETVFLEVMVRGKMSLYTMIDEHEKVHFYIENENGTHELSVKLVKQSEGVSYQRLETYKGTLKGLFPSCTDIFPAIDKTVLSRKGIQAIFKRLYVCRFGEDVPIENKGLDKPVTDIGIIAGVSSSGVDFNADKGTTSSNGATSGNSYFLDEMSFSKKSVAPTGGVYIETRFSRSKKFAMRHEIGYMQYENKSDEYKLNDYTSNRYYATVSAKYIKYNFIVRTYFLHGSVRPFANVGVSGKYALSTYANMERINGPNPGNTSLFEKVVKAHIVPIAGVGVIYGPFAIDLRYERSRGLNSSEITSVVNTTYLTFSYRLK